MSHADFVHLRVHSAYSLLEGALPVKQVIKLCQGERMPAVAVTDTNNLFGALEFSTAATDAGVQPIIGCQLNLTSGDPADPRSQRRPAPAPVVLLAQDDDGYANLCKIVSKAYLETEPGDDPQVTLAALEELAAGVILLVGMIGSILLTLRHKESVRRQDIAAQNARDPNASVEMKKVPTGEGLG